MTKLSRVCSAICALPVSLALSIAGLATQATAEPGRQDAVPVKVKNISASRGSAMPLPRSESDQALLDGWPLYRTERGQSAFNDAMAALSATDGASPAAAAFKGCSELNCGLVLPAAGPDGWLPAGRIWVSPTSYVLIAHSPRLRGGQRRRTLMDMRYFVFHEFHNSSRNTDMYDTISSHSGGVFVPFYMSKQATDAKGRAFVIVMQIAPYDVVSVHASNHGSAGPGIEVAKNASDALEPLQGHAGTLIATMVKTAVPRLQVVNHRGSEGLAMLRGYEQHVAKTRALPSTAAVALPFTPAPARRVAEATGRLEMLIARGGASPRLAVAERGFLPPKTDMATLAAAPTPIAVPQPAPAMSRLATYLKVNLDAMKRAPDFAKVIPKSAAAVAENASGDGTVYLLDARQQILGRVEPRQEHGAIVNGKFVYAPLHYPAEEQAPFRIDFTRPVVAR